MRAQLALITLPIALLVGLPGVASATPGFPANIQSDLSLSYTPPCTICHTTLSGGAGTVTRPFGQAMQQNGLVANDAASVQTALDALEAAMTDSDCDKVLDIDQLKEGRDPNTGEYIDGSGKTSTATDGCMTSSGGTINPAFGCGAQVAAGSVGPTAWQTAAALATVLALGIRRRRRRA